MDYVLTGLENVGLPLTLVDVGGRITPQNEEIFKRCDAFVVLSSKDEAMDEWRRFGEDLGLRCIALLKSRLAGEETVSPDTHPLEGTVVGLHRGTVNAGPVMQRLAQRVLSRCDFSAGTLETAMDTTITTQQLSELLGKAPITKTLPNGRVVSSINWEGTDLPKIDTTLRGWGFGADDHVVFDGPSPAWLGLSVVHGCHPAAASVNDPRLGTVPIGCQEPSSEGSGANLSFSVEERDEFAVVTFEIVGGVFSVDDLNDVTPPAVQPGMGIVLSGRGPNWLTISLAMAYHNTPWLACYQPGVGATVAMTHSPAMKLGTVIAVDPT